jgi:hypothetical protein
MSQETIEKTFTVPSPAHLDLSNIRGKVEVLPGVDGEIQVVAILHTTSGDRERTEIEISQASDGSVKVATRFVEGQWKWLFSSQPCRVDYFVKAPRASTLKLSGVANSTLVEGFEGDFSIHTVSGELTLRQLKGKLAVNTVSGDVAGADLTGTLDLQVVSGDVRASGLVLEAARVTTVSGSLSLDGRFAEGSYRFNSVSGNVTLSLPVDTQCSASLHTISGDIRSDFPVTRTTHSPGSQRVEVRGGGTKFTMDSISGDLRLRIAGEVPVAA